MHFIASIFMQKLVNIAVLKPESLEEPACKVGSWLASGNLDFRRVSTTLTYEWPTVPTLLIQIIWFVMNACCPSESLEFWYLLADRLIWWSRNKNPGHWGSKVLSNWQHFACAVITCCWGNWVLSESTWKHALGFLWTSSHTFSHCWFCCRSFEINHSHGLPWWLKW